MTDTPIHDAQECMADNGLLLQALSCAANAIMITTHFGKIIWVNQAFSQISGYSAAEAVGASPAILKSGRQGDNFYGKLWQTILAGLVWQGEVTEKRKDGTIYTVQETITPLFDKHGVITHFIAIQHDISLQHQQRERDHHLALHDVLTDLPNRLLFQDVQHQAISHARRMQHMLAILYLDLDGFKQVNDSCGHAIGDQLLVAVAERLRSAMRQEDTVARFGGDEFAILLTDIEKIEHAQAIAEKLLGVFSSPFILRGKQFNIGASIGVTIYPIDGDDPETLLNKADQAMYAAKRDGGRGYRLYHTAD